MGRKIESKRALVGTKIKPLLEEEARKKQQCGQGGVLLSANLHKANTPIHSSREAAQAVNVSSRSVENASKVLRESSLEKDC